MTKPGIARRIRFKGEVESRHDADDLLEAPGDTVLVNRGRPRSLVMACPDGCGSTLTVNLDPRVAKAWRLYQGARGRSLYPSVWRDSGCEAHFILWKDHVLWCGGLASRDDEPEYDAAIESRVEGALSSVPQTSDQIADAIDEIPWEVSRALERLVRSSRAQVTGTRPRRYSRPDAGGMEGDNRRSRSWLTRFWE